MNALTTNYFIHAKNVASLFQTDPIEYIVNGTTRKLIMSSKTLSDILYISDIITCELDCFKLQ